MAFSATGLNYFDVASVAHINLTVFTNSVIAFMGLLFYLLMYLGTRHLLISTRHVQDVVKNVWGVFVSGTLLGGAFLAAVFQNPLRTTSIVDQIPATYYLEDNLILITAVLPVIAGWFLAMFAIVQLSILRNYAASHKQRRFISIFSATLIGLLVLTSGLQFFTQFNSMLSSVSVETLRIVAFAVLVSFTAICGFIALAAQQLHRS